MLRILMLEDSNPDGELIRYELRKAHVTFSFRRVSTERAFVKELGEFSPDLILSDSQTEIVDGREDRKKGFCHVNPVCRFQCCSQFSNL